MDWQFWPPVLLGGGTSKCLFSKVRKPMIVLLESKDWRLPHLSTLEGGEASAHKVSGKCDPEATIIMHTSVLSPG